ncbi:MAG: glycine/betaine ABC transporter substrate-binding protein [Vallitaleaceae bacterium]|jgi:osmoprotectant transport system substrate-binding protein|nr:glycine/betaine ABC transporter substrate-binding protein [Vallitaleaceae bacterium]
MKKILIILMASMLVLSMAGCAGKNDVIKITHKDYTEQRITGQLISLYLESKGYETDVVELSGTMLCYTALKNGDVDMYAEFTGSAYGAIFNQTEIIGVQETYDYVKKASEETDGITWLTPLGWNNTYVLTVRPETAEEYNLATISDLVAVSGDMILGSDDEFINRADGLVGLKELYTGLEFADEVSMDQGLTYAALKDSEIDINSSYSTDGRIAKYGLINLEDDKNFFPPYYVTPILKLEYAEENPEVVAALEELGGHWTSTDMQAYNLMVDEGESASDVAMLMLTDAGLLEK